MRRVCSGVVLLLVWASPPQPLLGGQNVVGENDLDFLLEGVSQISAPGVPGPLCVFGPNAFTVVVGESGKRLREPVVAAARLGKGRVVAFGHDGYFAASNLAIADTGRFLLNAVRWASSRDDDHLKIGCYQLPELQGFFQRQGLTAEAIEQLNATGLQAMHVLCLTHAARNTEEVSRFVEQGGGLLAASLGWGWLQLNPGKDLRADHPLNRILAPAGIVWTDGTLRRTAESGFAADRKVLPLAHAARALDALESAERGSVPLSKEEMHQAGGILVRAAGALPREDRILWPRLLRLRERAERRFPTPDRPLTADQPLARVAVVLQHEDMRGLPPQQIRPHPAVEYFPGTVRADATRVTRTIEVDTAVPGWHSTGLYAPPGQVIEARTPATIRDVRGLKLRIGAHNDRLWEKDSWKRWPEICRCEPMAAPLTRTASAFGGLIYIEVPPSCHLGIVSVQISGGVEAPHYVLGKTSLDSWRSKVRYRPAPWAELETKKVILTVPSTVVHGLDDPKSVMEFWDRVMDACAELASRPLKRERPERYVTDVQISVGYMHSGYPIMTHLDMAPVVVDRAGMVANRHRGVWGLFHEMGHNHQSSDWTFEGAGEVTVNLFTLYIFDSVCGIPPRQLRDFGEAKRAKTIQGYLQSGANFEQWKKEPFTALLMYIQLQEVFGWDAFKRVFAAYRNLPSAQRPKSDDEKRDEWMIRFSRTVGRNLGPFFQAWGVPTSAEARDSVAHLPRWMPENFPPR